MGVVLKGSPYEMMFLRSVIGLIHWAKGAGVGGGSGPADIPGRKHGSTVAGGGGEIN